MTSWGGETLVLRRDKPTGAWLIVALYSTRANGSGGGTRMRAYPDLSADLSAAVRDAQRLAEGMAAKFAICRLAFGGGKAVIALPSGFAERERPALLRRYGELVQSLGGRFVTAPDVGTSPADMDIIAETGAPYILARTEAAGGVGDSSGPTAVGVLAGIQATCAVALGDASLAGRRVLVQGAGSVGGRLLELLAEAGAKPLFSDVNPEAIALPRPSRLHVCRPRRHLRRRLRHLRPMRARLCPECRYHSAAPLPGGGRSRQQPARDSRGRRSPDSKGL